MEPSGIEPATLQPLISPEKFTPSQPDQSGGTLLSLCCRLYHSDFWSRWRKETFLFSETSGPTLGPTQLPIQWVEKVFQRGYSGRGVKLTTHLHVVLRLEMDLNFYSPHRPSKPCTCLVYISIPSSPLHDNTTQTIWRGYCPINKGTGTTVVSKYDWKPSSEIQTCWPTQYGYSATWGKILWSEFASR